VNLGVILVLIESYARSTSQSKITRAVELVVRAPHRLSYAQVSLNIYPALYFARYLRSANKGCNPLEIMGSHGVDDAFINIKYLILLHGTALHKPPPVLLEALRWSDRRAPAA